MASKSKQKRKSTGAERHRRLVETTRLIGASEIPKEFEKTLKKVTAKPGRWVKTKIKISRA